MPEAHTFLVRAERPWPADRFRQREVDSPAPHMAVLYTCPQHHPFEVTFSEEVSEDEIPLVWTCRQHGTDSKRFGHEDAPEPAAPYRDRRRDGDGRTHLDRLLERRSIAELEELLNEHLAKLAPGHG